MGPTSAGELVAALSEAPVGVAVMAAVEASVRDDVGRLECPTDSDPEAVARAVDAVTAMSAGSFLAMVLDAATLLAGPWIPDAPRHLAAAYELAPQRIRIARAVANRFGATLHGPAVPGRQEWWHSDHAAEPPFDRPSFTDLGRVYGNGEFPWDGLWTVTDPPPETHDGLVDAWELFPGPISRWRLPVRPAARIWTIDRPQDWARLVERYGRPASDPHGGWELPGPNQHRAEIEPLLAQPHQHAARSSVVRHLLPDWTAVSRDYDGVHLSWAGFITSEGFVTELAHGAVTMLRYWASERTLWLADVFGQPAPLDAPALSGRVSGELGISVRDDAGRRDRDLQVITTLLGRRRLPT